MNAAINAVVHFHGYYGWHTWPGAGHIDPSLVCMDTHATRLLPNTPGPRPVVSTSALTLWAPKPVSF